MSEYKFSSPEEFLRQIDGNAEVDFTDASVSYDNLGNKKGLIKIPKNVVLYIYSDASGCSFIRGMQPMQYMYFVFGKPGNLVPICSPLFLFDEKLLNRTRTIIFQRQMSPHHLLVIEKYKSLQSKFKYKMIWDMDDFIWWGDDQRTLNGVPKYNVGHINIDDNVRYASIEIMKKMDCITVSTEYLKSYIKDTLKIPNEVKVVPNAVPEYFWGRLQGNIEKKKLTENIIKPKFLYTGSPTHYSNQSPYGELKGDLDSAWVEYIIKNVNEDKIEFTCFGGLPFVFKSIENKIKVVNWILPFRYHLSVLEENAHFGIMPLVPNRFNYSKSDLKFLEYSIAGIVGIGTTFDNGFPSPYDNMPNKLNYKCSVNDIENLIEKLKDKDYYNNALQSQANFLYLNGRILESKEYISNWTKIV